MSEVLRLPASFRLVTLERCASTNEEARLLAEQGAAEGTLVWAREQSAGRGRRGRTWRSPRGNLYLSLLLCPAVPLAEAACLGMVAAVAVGEALSGLLPPHAEIRFKWPNDVLVGGRKLAGILLESGSTAADRLAWLIVGIGVNIASHPPDAAFPATSLAAEGGVGSSVEAVLEAVSGSLARWLDAWRAHGFAPAREAWLARAWRRGETIELRLEDATLAGRFDGLDPAGALLLALSDGTRRRISAGDVMGLPVRA